MTNYLTVPQPQWQDGAFSAAFRESYSQARDDALARAFWAWLLLSIPAIKGRSVQNLDGCPCLHPPGVTAYRSGSLWFGL